ncbi:hypothetical protein Esti_005120 [Eimeria stiedai]
MVLIEPSYADTRTIIYIWGRRLFAEQNGFVSEGGGGPYHQGSSASLCQPVVLQSLHDVRIVEVVVGETHALFLSDRGKLFAYGEGAYGQLGIGEIQLVAQQPQLVKDLPGDVVQIAAGDFHSLALTGEGSVFSWGCAECVGDGSGTNQYTPRELRLAEALPTRGPSSPVCRRIAARYSQSMAVMLGGPLLVWGHAFHARFFHAPRVTFIFSNAHKVIQLAIGKAFALALTEQGQVLAWGDGTYGELAGNAFQVGSFSFEPVALKDANGQQLPPIIFVAAGARHALLVAQDLRLWAFGDNLAGQCGVPGHQTKLTAPKLVKVGELRSRVARVACGHRHSGCITPNHQLYMWGHSSSHKLIFTVATEAIISGETQPGVAIRSGLKNAYCRARLIYSMLHQKVTQLALGSDFTVIVTGDGDAEHRQGDSAVSSLSSQEQSTESWASPHIVTAADLHIGEGNNSKNASAKAASSFSTAGSQLRTESALLNGVEADAQGQEEVP